MQWDIGRRVYKTRYQQSKYCALHFFLHLRNFETERYTQEKHEIKSFDLQEIYEFNLLAFCGISLRSKVTEVKKNWSAQYIFD